MDELSHQETLNTHKRIDLTAWISIQTSLAAGGSPKPYKPGKPYKPINPISHMNPINPMNPKPHFMHCTQALQRTGSVAPNSSLLAGGVYSAEGRNMETLIIYSILWYSIACYSYSVWYYSIVYYMV